MGKGPPSILIDIASTGFFVGLFLRWFKGRKRESKNVAVQKGSPEVVGKDGKGAQDGLDSGT